MFEELCETIEASWDNDGEMRLTSASIESRLNKLFSQYPRPPNDLSETDTSMVPKISTVTDSLEQNNRRNLSG